MSEMMQRQAATTAARMSMENHAAGGEASASESAGTTTGGDGGSLSTMLPISQDSVDGNLTNQGVKIGAGGNIDTIYTDGQGAINANMLEAFNGNFLAPGVLNQDALVPQPNDTTLQLEPLSGSLGEAGKTITNGPTGGQRGG